MEKNIVQSEEKNIEKTREMNEITPAVDIYENDDEILLHVDMPGVVKEDIKVDIDNGTLSIAGIRKLETKGIATYEEFTDAEYVRSFSVPQTIEVDKVEAELKNGILKLHLPKSEAVKPKQIEIKTA